MTNRQMERIAGKCQAILKHFWGLFSAHPQSVSEVVMALQSITVSILKHVADSTGIDRRELLNGFVEGFQILVDSCDCCGYPLDGPECVGLCRHCREHCCGDTCRDRERRT